MVDVSSFPHIVLDASVILTWLLPLETLQEKANMLLRQYMQTTVDIRCPPLISYEVLNGLRSAVLSRRIKDDQLDEAYERYRMLEVPIDYLFVPNNETVRLAISHGLSVYDASYVHFAVEKNRVLYTADRKLTNKLKGAKIPIVYIGDFS